MRKDPHTKKKQCDQFLLVTSVRAMFYFLILFLQVDCFSFGGSFMFLPS